LKAAKNIKGLQLSLSSLSMVDMNKFYCINVNFSQAGLNYFAVLDRDENQVDIAFPCFCGLMPGRKYEIGVRTMPVDITGSSEYNTLTKVVHLPPSCMDSAKINDVRCQKSAAAQWEPPCITFEQNISTSDFQGDYSSVEVAFALAPDSYCLDVYDLFVYQDKSLELIDNARVQMVG
jgi:hypothetical protein